jgi:hypothetical protein
LNSSPRAPLNTKYATADVLKRHPWCVLLAQRSNFKEELVCPELHDPEEVSKPVRDDVDLAVRALERESVYLEARKIFNSLTPAECQELQCSVALQHGRMTQEERDKAEPQVRHEESSQLHQLVMKELSKRVITSRKALQAEQERKDNLMKSQQLEEKLRDISRAKGTTRTQSAEPRPTRKIASSSRERSKSADYVRTDVDQCANGTHLCAFTDPKDTTSKDLQAVIHEMLRCIKTTVGLEHYQLRHLAYERDTHRIFFIHKGK